MPRTAKQRRPRASVVAELEDSRARERAAVASTEFDREEAALVQWILDPQAGGYPELRARFAHRLKGVSDETLDRTRGVLKLLGDAFRENDVEALRLFGNAWETLMGVADQSPKILRAFFIVDAFFRHTQSDGPEWARQNDPSAIFMLVPFDPAFGKLTHRELARKAIEFACKRSSTGNTGRGHKQGRGLLAWAMGRTHAFGARDEAHAIKKINEAKRWEKSSKPKTPASRPSKG
jgi:hypothetical protein